MIARRTIVRAALAAFAAVLGGCASVGPSTLARDRIDYDAAITSSWKRAMLLNMVKLRYGDTPMFLGADPDFDVVANAMRRLQGSGSVGLRVEPGDGHELTVMILHRKGMGDDERRDSLALRKALGIDPDATEIRVVNGSVPKGGRELALVTRSMLEILLDLASAIEAPPEDVARGIVPAAAHFENDAEEGCKPLIAIHSGAAEPERAFVAVPYHGHWFWIDEADYRSKGIFSFVMMIFSLMDTSAPRGQPIVTVSAS